jgi:cytoskeletal protein CcmA (bactofilin family)
MTLFGKKQKDLMDSHISTIIADGCKIDGNISSSSSIRIDGQINGDVQASQGIILGETGKVLGNINASEGIIFGSISGNISVQKLEIKSTGKISGDISTQTIELEFGAVYNGSVKMIDKEPSVLKKAFAEQEKLEYTTEQ